MCLRPISINQLHRTKFFHLGYSSQVGMQVPCCSCDECLNAMQSDYQIRASAEYRDCTSKGGKVAFLTFTYSDNNVPFVVYSYNHQTKEIDYSNFRGIKTISNLYLDSDTDFVYSFSKKDIQRCFNSVRKYFERLGVSCSFRYFITSEYGADDRYTQRPHYHALIYLDKHSLSKLENADQILTIFSYYWKHGIVSPSKKGLFIKNEDAIFYVSKYVNKSQLLIKLKKFNKLYSLISDKFDDFEIKNYPNHLAICKSSYFRYYLKQFDSSLFCLKSKNFGISAISKIQDLLKLNDWEGASQEIINGYSFFINGKMSSIPYPPYYMRKLCYDIRSDGSYCLSHYGYQLKLHLAQHSVDEFIKKIKSIDPKNLCEIARYEESSYLYQYDSFLKERLSNISYLNNYAIYSKFVQGRLLPADCYPIVSKIFKDPFLTHEFLNLGFFIKLNYGYVYEYDAEDDILVANRHTLFEYTQSYPLKYSDTFYNSDFELFKMLITLISTYSRKTKSELRNYDKTISKYLSDISNNYEYHFNYYQIFS